MRVLVCGGRNYANKKQLFEALDNVRQQFGIELIIQGGASGADALAKAWANENKIQQQEFKADWNLYGKSAWPIRNKKMLDDGKPDLVYAFDGGVGTLNMIKQSKAAGIHVWECAA